MKHKRFIKNAARVVKKNKTIALLSCVLALASFLRLYDIASLGLFPSDAGTYLRFSTWILGRGGIPIDWEPPFYSALMAFVFGLFGVHDYVAMTASAVLGIAGVLATFFIGRKLFDAKTGLIAALFLAVTEHHIIYSRVTLADILTPIFFPIFFMLFYVAFKRNSLKHYALSGIALGLCFLMKNISFLCLTAAVLFFIIFHARKRTDGKFDAKSFKNGMCGIVIVALITATIFTPWVITMGLGAYMSSGRSQNFSFSDVDVAWAAANAPMLFLYGIEEQLFVFDVAYSDGTAFSNDPGYYFRAMPILISPVIILLCLFSLKRIMKSDKVLFLWIGTVVFLLFFTFVITYKADRLLLPMLPLVSILAARGAMEFKNRNIFMAAIALAAVTGMIFSIDTVLMKHDGFRKTGLYITENVGSDDRIFYTGMPQLLFYHEVSTGNYWEHDDVNGTKDITLVILENHKYRDYNSFFDYASFERDFEPDAVFINDDPWEQINGFASKNPDYQEIRIYKPGKDISSYFHWGDS